MQRRKKQSSSDEKNRKVVKTMRNRKKRGFSVLCLLLAGALLLAGCTSGGQTVSGENLMAGFTGTKPEKTDLNGPGAQEYTNFAAELLKRVQQAEPGKNVLLSPLSVLSALTMTANGAEGETLSQMETALGLPAQEMSRYLASYTAAMPSGEKYRFHNANSLWFREGQVKVKRDFLQKNADYFGADVFQKPFDESTVEEINQWVSDNTQGMIPSIVDKITDADMLYLINALSFEGEWENIYYDYNVNKGIFTREDGAEQEMDAMCSMEYCYLKDSNAAGFLKNYADQRYAFGALLPDEGVSLGDYLAGLDGEKLRGILTGGEEKDVHVELPKFEAKYGTKLKEVLQAMGMERAFDPGAAEFSPMAETRDPLHIGSVFHKTYISLFEEGTRAAAVTEVEMIAGAAFEEEPEEVCLNRPFLYMIVDKEAMQPIFIGTVYDVNAQE